MDEVKTGRIQTEGGQESEQKPILPVKKGYRTNRQWLTHGAHFVVRAYHAGAISRRTTLGRMITRLENQYAEHMGFKHLGDCPVTLVDTIQLIVGLKLYIASFEPGGGKQGHRDFHTAINSLTRLVASLGLTPAKKPEVSLADYLSRGCDETQG